ncbi:MAG: EAL domain-containing protein [Sideroxyarcus sp.]|nr:EAL domain-containing protein [Sideroxyarcus sp.]
MLFNRDAVNNTWSRTLDATIEERTREHEFRTLAENLPDRIVRYDLEGRTVYVNPLLEKTLGADAARMIGKRVRELFPDGSYEVYAQAVDAALASGENREIEFVVPGMHNAPIIHQIRMVAVRDEHGEVSGVLAIGRDITERKRTEAALAASEQQFRSLAENFPDNVIRYDLQCRASYYNPRMVLTLGIAPEAILGLTPVELGAGGLASDTEYERHVRLALESGETSDMELTFQQPGGEVVTHLIRFSAERDTQGNVSGALAIGRDITELKKVEINLRIAAAAFESQEGMVVTDAEGVILRINSAFTRITGYAADEVVGKKPNILKSGRQDQKFYAAMWESINTSGFWEGEIWNKRKNENIYPEHLTISAVKNLSGVVSNYVGTLTDITMSKKSAEEIQHLAFYDALTGLPNRRLLQDRMNQALSSSLRTDRLGSILFIDLDNFKSINDTLGHDIGDLLLQQASQRIHSCLREGDTVSRQGGDEFIVMLNDLSGHELEAANQTELVGEKILASLRLPYRLSGRNYHVTSSIGAALFGSQNRSIEEIMRQADIAMYQAKKDGRNTLRFFDPAMQVSICTRAELERDLRIAIEKHQFELYYQLHTDSSRAPLGAEALIRWNHPERGLVSPAEFIPFAEEAGLILPIDSWVLETACHQLKEWERDELTRDLILSVNISAKQFHQNDFVERVKNALNHHGIKASRLRFELTETILVDNIQEAIVKMSAIREMGIAFSLDDFGTGYSSLQYLQRLPLIQLKIDQSFVKDIFSNENNQRIVETIISMALGLKLEVIAEGVETEEQLEFLATHGCQQYQGYLFGKPMPADKFKSQLELRLS